MKRLFIYFVLCSLVPLPDITAQETLPKTAAPNGYALEMGAGILSATDLLDRHLSQDLDGYKDFQYKIGLTASVQYQWGQRWGMNISWNRGGSTATKTSFGSGKYKKRDRTVHSFSLLFERRFGIRAHHYFYWGVGLGVSATHEEKTPTVSAAEIIKTNHIGFWPQWKPIGVSFRGERVTPYFETGMFSLPLVTGGLRVRL
jgi:hypothetical protein